MRVIEVGELLSTSLLAVGEHWASLILIAGLAMAPGTLLANASPGLGPTSALSLTPTLATSTIASVFYVRARAIHETADAAAAGRDGG